MIKLEPFKKEHYKSVVLESEQKYLIDYVTEEDLIAVESNPFSVTVFKDGIPVAVGGIILQHETRGEAWCVTSNAVKNCMLGFHKLAVQYLKSASVRRIEAVVNFDFIKGHRWARALGFELEAPVMRAHALNGKDASLYAIVKGGDRGR